MKKYGHKTFQHFSSILSTILLTILLTIFQQFNNSAKKIVKQYSPTFGTTQQGTGNAKQLALPNTEVAPALRHQKVQAVRVGGRVLQRHLCGQGKRTIGPYRQWYMSEMIKSEMISNVK